MALGGYPAVAVLGGSLEYLNEVSPNAPCPLRRNPRNDHRTTIVHFAVSAPDQVDRIKHLGAIVSANPYYVTALADKYSETGKSELALQALKDPGAAGRIEFLESEVPQ